MNVTEAGRAIGSQIPGRLRQPSSMVSISLLRQMFSGLMSGVRFPLSITIQSRSDSPICGAARPTPSASCTVCSMSLISFVISFDIFGIFAAFFRNTGFFSPVTMGSTAIPYIVASDEDFCKEYVFSSCCNTPQACTFPQLFHTLYLCHLRHFQERLRGEENIRESAVTCSVHC